MIVVRNLRDLGIGGLCLRASCTRANESSAGVRGGLTRLRVHVDSALSVGGLLCLQSARVDIFMTERWTFTLTNGNV